MSSGAAAPNPDSLAQKRREVLAFTRDAVDKAKAEHEAHGEEALGRLSLLWKVPRIHVRRLIGKGEQYMSVLANVLEGRSYPECAELLGITRREVELTVRYIEELMKERGFS